MARTKQSKVSKKRVIKVVKTGGISKKKIETEEKRSNPVEIEDICTLLGKVWIDVMDLDKK